MITRLSERVTESREHMRGGAGTVLLTPISKEIPQNARLFSEIRLRPGMSIGYHVHEKETELFDFLSGKGRAQDDEAFYDVSAGDSIATPSGHGHAIECVGEEDLVIVAVIIKD